MKKNKGFTLIELLVVIAIIGLLSTLAVVALNNARQKSRDARRVADVKQVQTAFELYYNDCNRYPGTAAGDASVAGSDGTCSPANTTTYMNSIPKSPAPPDGDCGGSGSLDYTYAVQDTGASYTLAYCLGAATGGIPAGNQTATPAGIQ